MVIFQFAASVILILGTAVVGDQLAYLQSKKLGYDKEKIVMLPILKNISIQKKWSTIKAAFLQSPNVLATTASYRTPDMRGNMAVQMKMQGADEDEPFSVPIYIVDREFTSVYGVKLIAGKALSHEDVRSNKFGTCLVNETLVRKVGWQSPEEAIGKQIELSIGSLGERTIVGVVEDFNFKSLHEKIEPLVLMMLYSDYMRVISVKFRGNDIPNTMAFLKTTWKQFAPEYPFEYAFLDNNLNALYRGEERWARVLKIFSLLAIFIACLGLVGLVSFATEQRTKEIGIRKVMGASASGIVILFAKGFVKLVILANLIAWPIAYWGISHFLEAYPYRVTIDPSIFAIGSIITLGLALLSVGLLTVKAAHSNPIETLRHE